MKLVRSLPGLANSSNHTHSCDDDCHVCFLAKQPRTSFPLSNNKAVDLFALIRCDIWCSYPLASSYGAHYFLTIVDDYSRAT